MKGDMYMCEVWQRLVYHGNDYGDFYEVSNLGNIRNAKTHKVRSLNVSQTGYYFVSVSLGSREEKPTFKVHRAVAESFIPNPNDHPFINHIDGNKLNNHVDNLEWCTPEHNMLHAIEKELWRPAPKGYKNKLSKLSKEQTDYIKQNYIPYDKEFGSRALGRKFGVHHTIITKAYNYEE